MSAGNKLKDILNAAPPVSKDDVIDTATAFVPGRISRSKGILVDDKYAQANFLRHEIVNICRESSSYVDMHVTYDMLTKHVPDNELVAVANIFQGYKKQDFGNAFVGGVCAIGTGASVTIACVNPSLAAFGLAAATAVKTWDGIKKLYLAVDEKEHNIAHQLAHIIAARDHASRPSGPGPAP